MKRGDRFRHKRLLDVSQGYEAKVPLLCVVTAVRGGMTYYRPDYGTHDDGSPWLGSPAYFKTAFTYLWADPIQEVEAT